jgi:hypothetical protein
MPLGSPLLLPPRTVSALNSISLGPVPGILEWQNISSAPGDDESLPSTDVKWRRPKRSILLQFFVAATGKGAIMCLLEQSSIGNLGSRSTKLLPSSPFISTKLAWPFRVSTTKQWMSMGWICCELVRLLSVVVDKFNVPFQTHGVAGKSNALVTSGVRAISCYVHKTTISCLIPMGSRGATCELDAIRSGAKHVTGANITIRG